MATKLNRTKQRMRSWRTEYHNVRRFMNDIMDIAVKRQRGYAERRHGDILNKECMDEVVERCRAFNRDRFDSLENRRRA